MLFQFVCTFAIRLPPQAALLYYRDPEAKYAELTEILYARKPKQTIAEVPPAREVEIRIKGVDISKFGSEDQEKLLKAIAEVIDTPRTNLKLTVLRAGSLHAFVSMPADAAYRLKTAALNRDARLIHYGMDALRLTGDRHFVLLTVVSPKIGNEHW